MDQGADEEPAANYREVLSNREFRGVYAGAALSPLSPNGIRTGA